jgi:hypothetical protein
MPGSASLSKNRRTSCELREYAQRRGWDVVEYVDRGVSGSKDRRPALDQLTLDVRRHKVEAVVCWKLDRLGRNLRHLVLLLDDWQQRGVTFVTLGEGIDTSTAAGRLVAGMLASIAEFERGRCHRCCANRGHIDRYVHRTMKGGSTATAELCAIVSWFSTIATKQTLLRGVRLKRSRTVRVDGEGNR